MGLTLGYSVDNEIFLYGEEFAVFGKEVNKVEDGWYVCRIVATPTNSKGEEYCIVVPVKKIEDKTFIEKLIKIHRGNINYIDIIEYSDKYIYDEIKNSVRYKVLMELFKLGFTQDTIRDSGMFKFSLKIIQAIKQGLLKDYLK